MTVDIYTETSWKSPKKRTGVIAYLIVARYDNGEDWTQKKMCHIKTPMSKQAAQTLVDAMALQEANGMARLKDQPFHIISSDPWTRNMIVHLQGWKENGWLNARGTEIDSRGYWEAIARIQSKRALIFQQEHDADSGVDRYQTWLIREVEEAYKKVEVALVQRKGVHDGR